MSDQNTSVHAGLSAMIQASQSGQDLRSAFNSPDSVQAAPTPEPATNNEESSTEQEDTAETINVSEGLNESGNSSVKVKADDKSDKAKAADIEEITFTDTKGRRTVKVDFSDRDKLKKIASLAYGSRKFQAERDQFKQDLAKEREDAVKLKSDMSKFESIYEKEGLKGLALLLEGPEGFNKFLKSSLQEQERWDEMPVSERNALIRERELEARVASEKTSKEEYERRLGELDKRQRDADEKVFESKLHPAFDRYRFAGKLGDPVAEHKLDKAVWADVMDALQPYEDKGVEITQAMIDKEFRKASQELSKVVNTQVQKNTKVALQKVKNTAQTKAQAKVTQGMQTSTDSEQFKKDISSGNTRDALRAFLGGKVKLTR